MGIWDSLPRIWAKDLDEIRVPASKIPGQSAKMVRVADVFTLLGTWCCTSEVPRCFGAPQAVLSTRVLLCMWVHVDLAELGDP
jgi:hypothetical protein